MNFIMKLCSRIISPRPFRFSKLNVIFSRNCPTDSGPGSTGPVREGEGIGKYGAAKEEEFFYHKKREQLEKLKEEIKKREDKEGQDKPKD